MRIVLSAARLLCTAVILIAGFYTVIGMAVAGFIVTGTLTPGEVMIFEEDTPALAETLGFVVAGVMIVAACAFVRQRLPTRG